MENNAYWLVKDVSIENKSESIYSDEKVKELIDSLNDEIKRKFIFFQDKKDICDLINKKIQELSERIKAIKENIPVQKLRPNQERDLNRQRKKEQKEGNEEELIGLFNEISIKNNNHELLKRKFEFMNSWKEISKYMPKEMQKFKRFIFPNVLAISEVNYVSVYQEAYDIKNFKYAGERERHIILTKACIVTAVEENSNIILKITQKGEGYVE